MNTLTIKKFTRIHFKILHICFQPVEQRQHQLRGISLKIMGNDNRKITIGRIITRPLPGIYDMPIRIRWMPNHLDENKDNTITIRLTGNNQGLTMGLPGPDGLQRELVIEKQN